MSRLDAIDRSILRVLKQNARMTNADIAQDVGLSPSACLRRIRAMEHSSIIQGYTVIVGEAASESAMAVIINITLERQTEDAFNRFEAAIRKHPEIQECYLMTGESDYLLRVDVQNSTEFERIHTEILAMLPGVARIQSSFSIRNVLARRRRRIK